MVKQLPKVTDPNFRAALKEAREAANLSYRELAKRAGIHEVMPSRYENAEHSNSTLPSLKTWEKLNEVLFASYNSPEGAGDARTSDNTEFQSTLVPGEPLLKDASTDEIVAELKRRGASSVSISW